MLHFKSSDGLHQSQPLNNSQISHFTNFCQRCRPPKSLIFYVFSLFSQRYRLPKSLNFDVFKTFINPHTGSYLSVGRMDGRMVGTPNYNGKVRETLLLFARLLLFTRLLLFFVETFQKNLVYPSLILKADISNNIFQTP